MTGSTATTPPPVTSSQALFSPSASVSPFWWHLTLTLTLTVSGTLTLTVMSVTLIVTLVLSLL